MVLRDGFTGALIGVFGMLGGYSCEESFVDGSKYVRISPPEDDKKISLSRPRSLFVTYTSVPTHQELSTLLPGGALTAMIV